MSAQEETDKELARLRETFKMFDLHNNGMVTVENLMGVMQTLGMNPTKEEVEDILKDMDIDGDGMINFDDFSKRMKVEMESAEEEAELRNAFILFDKDKSGKLNFEELRVALSSIGERLSNEQVQKMLQEADRNGDGEIDYDEFVTMMNQ